MIFLFKHIAMKWNADDSIRGNFMPAYKDIGT